MFPGRLLAFWGCCIAVMTSATADETVSFEKDIAPVFVDQCLVCHNTRTSKGRFSLETFTALMKGGESGPAVAPGDPDASNLWLLVDSGEMPKDGDPLSAQQVSMIKRWIAEGSKIADESLTKRSLASIIPRPTQPPPPDTYPAPVPVTALAFGPNGRLIAVAGYREVLLFDVDDGRLVRRIGDLAERVYGLSISPDGQHLAVAAGTPARLGDVRLFEVATGQLAKELATSEDSFFDVIFSPDGSHLAAAGSDRSVRIWKTGDYSEVRRIDDHADWVVALAFSPDGARLATASRDKTAKVFDAVTGESLVTFGAHEQPVLDVLFSPDGAHVISCGKDQRLRIWKVEDGKQSKTQKFKGDVTSLAAFGSDAFLCGGAENSIGVFTFDGEKRSSVDQPEWVLAIASSPDGQKVAVGSFDGTVAIKDVATGEILQTLKAMPPRE